MFESNQKNLFNGTNGRDRINLTLLILILGILSVASIGILVLAMLRQMYPKVFAAPGINKQLNYQGKLQDADGITVPDGSYNMKFTIYDAASDGTALWSARETDACGAPINPSAKSISVYNGVFSTLLGESGDCPITLDFADDAYYLGVTVGADSEMTPRKRIGAAGYAFNADLLDGLNTSNAGGTTAFVPVTDSSGNFILSADVTFDGNTFFLEASQDNIGIGTVTPNAARALDLTTSKKYGVYSETSSTTSETAAVYGAATDTSGSTNYGGYFTAAGNGAAVGVYGRATGASPFSGNFGGYFVSDATSSGTGVYGEATDTDTMNFGGYFVSQSDFGRAVYGGSFGTTGGPNFGGYFQASGVAGSVGVYGEATNSSGANYGGYFTSAGSDGFGVYGAATATGATENYGGWFTAAGDSGYGVVGSASGSSGRAVYGSATGSSGWGVYGSATGSSGRGVYGAATSATGTTYGVFGTVNSSSGWAGYFTGGYGLYTDNDLYVGGTSETIANPGFTMTGAGSGFFADQLGVESNVYTDGSFIAGSTTTYGDGSITTSSGDLIVTPAGGELSVVGNMESLASASFNPVLKGSVATGSYPRSVYVFGRYAYIVNYTSNTLQIFDVSNPSSPVLVGSVGTTGSLPVDVFVSGRYAYVAEYSTPYLEIFDVSNPSSPTSVGTLFGGTPNGVYVSGHYAYVTHYNPTNTFDIIDVSDPASPITVGSAATGGSGPGSVFVSGSYAYVLTLLGNTLEIFNVSDPANPSLVGSVATGSTPVSVYVSGRYAYVTNFISGTLQIFNISNPASPVLVSTTSTGNNPYEVYVSGRYAYLVNGTDNTLQVFDVSNPSSPTSVGLATTGITPDTIYVAGRYAYIGNVSSNTLEVFDISGLETTSAMIHSLEAGNLQVRNDIIAQGELNVGGGLSVAGSGFFNDSLTVHTSGLTSGWFQADGSGATGLIGYTTNTFSTTIQGIAFGDDSTGVMAGAFSTTGVNKGGSFAAGTGSTSIGGTGHTMGVQGIADGGTGTNFGGVFTAGNLVSTTIAGSNNIGVAGFAEDSTGTNYGGYFKADGTAGAGYGVYSTVIAATDWAGYFTGSGLGLYTNRLAVNDTSAVAYNTIGTASASHTAAGEIENNLDLFIFDDLEVDGYAWFDGGHTDLAEMINYNGQGEAGDVIVIDDKNNNTAKLADKPYDKNVIGIISTKPSLIITGDIKEGKLLAVAGRVPTKVTNINGPIARGDLLTTSSVPGHAMKAIEPGPIVGKALEPCNANSCTILVFLNVGWYGGASTSAVATSSSQSVVYQTIGLEKLTADLDADGFAINNISKISGVRGKWAIDENGLLRIEVEFERDKEIVKKEIYTLSSTGVEIVLSGSAKLDKGEVLVDFGQVDKDFIEIIDEAAPLKISVTPTELCAGLYVAEKYPQGFKVKELNGGTSNAAFDWIVIGKRKGY